MDNFKETKIVLNSQLVNYYKANGNKKNGPVVLMLHGWGGEAKQWFNVMEKISNEASQLFAVDLPGFGKSENPKIPFDVESYTKIIERFIKKMSLSNIIIIGHSFGGRITTHLAVRNIDVVSKIVLVNSAGVTLNKIRNKFLPKLSKIFKFFITKKMKAAIYDFLDSDYSLRPDLKETFKKIMDDDMKLYSKIKTSTLIIWGDRDSVTPLKSGKMIHKEIKNSELFVIPGVGHMSFVHNPNMFVSKIKEFIK